MKCQLLSLAVRPISACYTTILQFMSVSNVAGHSSLVRALVPILAVVLRRCWGELDHTPFRKSRGPVCWPCRAACIQEASGSSADSTSDLGATLRQAAARALATIVSLAHESITLVAPSRPQPPGTGANVRGAAWMNMDCCSGVSWTVATESAGPSKLANTFRDTRKFEWPQRKTSSAFG
jgi:hypothetical protein